MGEQQRRPSTKAVYADAARSPNPARLEGAGLEGAGCSNLGGGLMERGLGGADLWVRGRRGGFAERLGRAALRGSSKSHMALDTDLVVAMTIGSGDWE